MDLKLLKKVIEIAETSLISELEIQEGELRIRIAKGGPGLAPVSPLATTAMVVAPAPAPVSTVVPLAATPVEKEILIQSPMVGTFYRSPAPDASPYVKAGDRVTEETIVCIIEAMKVMNELPAGVCGVITETLIENAQPVEYGQPLFRVKPD